MYVNTVPLDRTNSIECACYNSIMYPEKCQRTIDQIENIIHFNNEFILSDSVFGALVKELFYDKSYST